MHTMPAENRPDLLIVGDSHSIALKAGCDTLGMDTELLSFSGNLWHLGHIVLHRHHGIWARSPALQHRLQAVAQRFQSAYLPAPDVPVIATFGFHLGRGFRYLGLRAGGPEGGGGNLADGNLSKEVASACV